MTLTRLAVRRPVGVTMFVLAFLLLSVIAYQNIGLDLLPDLELPVAAIAVVYPGADPTTIETTLTAPIEDAISSVSGIQRIRSMSMENVSLILADFAWGANMDASMRDLQTNVNAIAPLLPGEATAPIVVRTDPSQWPLMLVSVSGELDVVELTRRVEQYVLPRLQSLPGVASVEILGGSYEEVTVRYDSDALQEHGVTPTLLYQILYAQNTVVPTGTVIEDGLRYQVRAGRQITSLEELKSQPVAQRQAAPDPGFGLFALGQSLPVQLREVADVNVSQIPREGATRLNGREAVLLRILKASGANTVAVADRIRAEVDSIQQVGDAGLTFDVITDQAELIRDSLKNVATSALIGAILAVAVLLFFLRSATSILVIAVAIPLSLIGTGTALYFAGVTLNLMSLGGLAISAGMLVDNAIVVLESMARHRSLGKSAPLAAADGGSEVGPAIIAATLTTLVVFIPITFVKDLTGQLFKDMALAVSAALTLSLIVALTVVPAAFARWGGRRDRLRSRLDLDSEEVKSIATVAPGLPEAAAASFDAADVKGKNEFIFSPVQRFYARTLRAWLSRRWLGPLTATLMLVALLVLPLGHPWTFLPDMDGGLITVSLSLPPGSPLSETIEIVEAYEREIGAIPEIDTILTTVGDQGSQSILSLAQNLGVHQASMTLVLAPHAERSKSAREIAHDIMRIRVRGDVNVVVHADRTAAALGDDYFPGVTIHVTGPDLERLRIASEAIVARLDATAGLANVAMSLDDPQPELLFRVTDRSFQGILSGGEPLTAGQVGLALRNHMTGIVATHILHEGIRLPVVLRPRGEESTSTSALQEFRVPGATLGGGQARPILGRIADFVEVDGPVTVDRLNRQRLVTIRAEMDGIGLAEGRALALRAIAEIPLPPGVSVEIGGIHRVIDDTVYQMIAVLLIGVLLVYAVLATQFESLKQPLILMLTVPLALVGGIAALRLLGHPFSVPAAIGSIVLVGIAVNNGIVMIDYINRLRANGFAPLEAVVEGSAVRLRPVLMTAMTTLLGLVPLAVSKGQGSEFQVPLALAIIGGMITSTILTLYILPSILLLATGGRSLRPVMSALLLIAVVALGGVGDAFAAPADSPWTRSAMVGSIIEEGESPTLIIGATGARRFDASHLSLSVAGGFDARAPLVIGLHGGIDAPTMSGRVAFGATADFWLRPAYAHETRVYASWNNAGSQGQIGLTHALGMRTPHPWSGRIPLTGEETWEAYMHIDDAPQGASAWDRSLKATFRQDQAPRWIVMNGVTFHAEDFIRARAGAGLLLQAGRYAPLFTFDTVVTLLPQGEIELTLGPNSGTVPLGWPVFGVGYRGRLGAFDVVSRAELGAGQSGFQRRSYVSVKPLNAPYALQFTWSDATHASAVLSLHTPF